MMPDEIYVVFTDQTDLRWLKFLRRGFRHCYVLLRFAEIWIAIDPLLYKTEVMRIDLPESFSLQGWIEQQGDRIIKVPLADGSVPRISLLSSFSCVGCIKRILGVGAGHILTPWQLYKYLTAKSIKQ